MGIAAEALGALGAHDVRVKYATIWIGQWNLDQGWLDTEAALRRIVEANATPLVQFYYWGDDLSPECFAMGCLAGNSTKDQVSWNRVAEEFADVVNRTIGTHPLMIVIESEFNKEEMHAAPHWDDALANMTLKMRGLLPHARFVLGFGNWGEYFWRGFDKAVAASDAVGLQAMRATTIDDREAYVRVAQRTIEVAKLLRDQFGKPVVLHDVALSSYPEPDGLALQEEAMRHWSDSQAALAEAGVEAFVYRSYWDTPNQTGYFREAEAHWGLVWLHNETAKPALSEFIRMAWRAGRA